MKKLYILTSIYFLLSATIVLGQHSTENNFTIAPGSVGSIKLHQNIDDIPLPNNSAIKMLSKFVEGEEEPSYSVISGKQTILTIIPELDNETGKFTKTVSEINVLSNVYKTSKNIQVGSSLKDFIQKYPKYKIWYTYVSNRYVIETGELNNIQFEINPKSYKGSKKGLTNSDTKTLRLTDFQPNATITSIRVF